jgi:hypothetical protein
LREDFLLKVNLVTGKLSFVVVVSERVESRGFCSMRLRIRISHDSTTALLENDIELVD